MQQRLTGVPETLLVPLWARAVETRRVDSIITDYKAVEMMENIEYDFTKFAKAWKSQVGVAVRTELFNKAAAAFIEKHPAAVIVNIGCGLDTRFTHVDNGRIQWYDLDLPEPIRIRKRFFRETERYRMLARSVFDYSWIDEISPANPVLLIAEGILMYFSEHEVKELLNKLVAGFPQAEMLLEAMTPTIVRMSRRHDAIGKMDAEFKWGVAGSKELEQYNNRIKVINEWNYFDYHKDRWGWLGWMAAVPAFKRRFNNRVVHLVFA